MIVGVAMGLALIGLWLWAELERNKREDRLKERVDQMERWIEAVQSKNGY